QVSAGTALIDSLVLRIRHNVRRRLPLAGTDQRLAIGRGAQHRGRCRDPHRCDTLRRQPEACCRFATAQQALSKSPQVREIEVLLAFEAIEPCEELQHRWRDADGAGYPELRLGRELEAVSTGMSGEFAEVDRVVGFGEIV